MENITESIERITEKLQKTRKYKLQDVPEKKKRKKKKKEHHNQLQVNFNWARWLPWPD